MPITEADYEYLLRTLSEARSKAAEIAFTVRSRLGGGHRLSELGSSAVSQIETVLQGVRATAQDESKGARSEEVRSPVQHPTERSKTPAENGVRAPPAPQPLRDQEPALEHWFPGFVNEVLEQFRASGGITFETVEHALQQRKQAFMTDLEIARRMYRTYPHLFDQHERASR